MYFEILASVQFNYISIKLKNDVSVAQFKLLINHMKVKNVLFVANAMLISLLSLLNFFKSFENIL